MSKRFTATEKWDDPWFSEIPNDIKLIWLYILDKCDHAGIYKINFRLMKFQCNTKKTFQTVKEYLKGRFIEIDKEKWFIPKFIKFQYPLGLNSEKPAIVSVRKLLHNYNLIDENNELIVIESFQNDYDTIKDTVKDKDIVKDKVKRKVTNDLLFDFFNNLLLKRYSLKCPKTKEKELKDLIKAYGAWKLKFIFDRWVNYHIDLDYRAYHYGESWKSFITYIKTFVSDENLNKRINQELQSYKKENIPKHTHNKDGSTTESSEFIR